MKKFYPKDIWKYIVLPFGLICLSIILTILINTSDVFKMGNDFLSLDQIKKAEKIDDNNLIAEIETENGLSLYHVNNDDLIITVLKGNSGNLFKKEKDVRTRDFFNIFKENTDISDIDTFEKVLNASGKLLNEKKISNYFCTIDSKKISMKVNGQRANPIITYQKNGQTYYFLFFLEIDASKKVEVSL